MRIVLPIGIALCLLVACTAPPATDYVGGTPTPASGAKGIAVGQNASGESCMQLPGGVPDAVDIYCGTWQLPAAWVRAAPAAGGSLQQLASGGPWRESLDLRFACEPPTATTILGGEPAELLRCTRRIGGWPQVALVAAVGGRVYLADGILPTVPVMERSIAVLSGRISAPTAAMPTSAADSLLASQLAARAFSAGDVGDYERLMALGARANLAEDFAAAETAYRAALVVQQKALGRNNPDTVNALMHLALQISDQGRFAEADALFKQAEQLAPRASDKAAVTRLLHYRALDALNQGHTQEALALLRRAGDAYAALVPPDALQAVAPAAAPLRVATSGSAASETTGATIADMPSQRLMIDPTAQSAMMGLIETWRYRAIANRLLDRPEAAASDVTHAESLARANQMAVPLVTARLTRTAATVGAASGGPGYAELGLARSRRDFDQVLPQTRPVAETQLLQADVLAQQGKIGQAVALCDEATDLLKQLRAGTDPTLLEPCLAADAREAEHDAARRQALLGRMFETAQLAQGSITSRQIGQAAARLAAGTHDPKVAEAIRRQQDSAQALADLYRQRDAQAQAGGGAPPGAAGTLTPAELDARIAKAQSDLADAGAALQAAAPNYGQLVQEVVPAASVLSALAPGEAFADITLTPHGGWTFLFRNGQIDVAPVHGDTAAMTKLVRRLRSSIEMTDRLPIFDVGASQALYDDTLGAVAARLAGARELVVAPSGPLLSIPFAVLLTGPARADDLAAAPWLIRQMSIAHVPSAANFVALRKAGTSRAPRPWIGFGGFRPVTLAQARATFPPGTCSDSATLLASLPPLTAALRELDAARRIEGAPETDEMLGANFTVPHVEAANLSAYRVLHFASHALLPTDLRCLDQPAIVTSPPAGAKSASGALLTASDVLGLNLNADLVILSACNSGGPGGTTAGESLSGLARAFFYAGARALLVTHWSVNDQAAAYLVVDTLQRLKQTQGGDVAMALRGAELSMLDAAGHAMPALIAHPFFWAPFAAIGSGEGAPAPQAAAAAPPRT
jgi:CHAT domain-containing protein/tetratricopeptide (TPR) repeat protein